MTKVLESAHLRLGREEPVVDVALDGMSRTLTFQGRVMYDLSVWCGTCSFLFERVGTGRSAVMPTAELSQRLRSGLDGIDEDVVAAFGELLPVADYVVSLIEVQPTLVYPGDVLDYFANEGRSLFGFEPPFYDLPANPRTPYYRAGSVVFERPGERWGAGTDEGPYQARSVAFGFLAPTESITNLVANTVSEYQGMDGAAPTAVAMSVLDVKSPAIPRTGWTDPGKGGIHIYWCWTHLLLDGHHKVRAASITGRPITVLSFTAVRRGSAVAEEINYLTDVLRR